MVKGDQVHAGPWFCLADWRKVKRRRRFGVRSVAFLGKAKKGYLVIKFIMWEEMEICGGE